MATTQHTARKSHPCLFFACGCSGTIQPGETYLRQFVPPNRSGEGSSKPEVYRAHINTNKGVQS